MSLRYVLLGLLAQGPSHGYSLKQRHDARFPQARPLAYGQVYTALQRLVRDGLVDVVGRDAGNGPERTSYRLTDKGRRELAHWLGEAAPAAPFVTNEIFTKLVAATLTGGAGESVDPALYLQAQYSAHMARIDELTALVAASSSDTSTVLSADYALRHLEADLRWMSTIMARLDAVISEIDTLTSPAQERGHS